MIKRTSRNWIPFWGDKWLFGSMRQEFDVAERGIWWDLMPIAMKDEGFIRANEDTPYLTQQLAGMLIIPEDLLERTIEKFIEKGKYTRLENGTLYITNWNKYCFTDRHMRRFEEESEGNEEQPSQEDIFQKMSIKCPPEFSEMASAKGYVRVNRLVVAVILGRPLLRKEEVHHRNKKERDNHPKNLMLFANHTDHQKYEWGEDIEPIWDGSIEKIEMSELTATMTRKSATSIREDKIRVDKNREEENRKDYPSEFESFWKNYPKKKEKKDAYITWKTLTKKQKEEVIIAAKHYKMETDALEIDANYIKNPKTFLNKKKEKWKDYLELPKIEKKLTHQERDDKRAKEWYKEED